MEKTRSNLFPPIEHAMEIIFDHTRFFFHNVINNFERNKILGDHPHLNYSDIGKIIKVKIR